MHSLFHFRLSKFNVIMVVKCRLLIILQRKNFSLHHHSLNFIERAIFAWRGKANKTKLATIRATIAGNQSIHYFADL